MLKKERKRYAEEKKDMLKKKEIRWEEEERDE